MTFADLLLIQVSSFCKHLHLKGRPNTKKVESFRPNANKRGLVNFATSYNCCHCKIRNMLEEIEMGDSNCWGHVKSLEYIYIYIFFSNLNLYLHLYLYFNKPTEHKYSLLSFAKTKNMLFQMLTHGFQVSVRYIVYLTSHHLLSLQVDQSEFDPLRVWKMDRKQQKKTCSIHISYIRIMFGTSHFY